jgi:hypothetical protein
LIDKLIDSLMDSIKQQCLAFPDDPSTVFETFATLSKSLPVKNWRIFWFYSPGINIPPGVDAKIASKFACP